MKMRYIIILMSIIIYWFLILLGMGFLVQDDFISSGSVNANSSYSLLETSDINFSSSDLHQSNQSGNLNVYDRYNHIH